MYRAQQQRREQERRDGVDRQRDEQVVPLEVGERRPREGAAGEDEVVGGTFFVQIIYDLFRLICMQRLLFNAEQVKVAEPGAARSLGMLASVVVETDQTDTAVRIAAAARRAIAQHCGEGSADHARAVMTLARAHFLAGRR